MPKFHVLNVLIGLCAVGLIESAHALPDTAAAVACALELEMVHANADHITVTASRALRMPLQLKIVRADTFEQTLTEVRRVLMSHLGVSSDGRDWVLDLDDIYPETMSTSVAHFRAMNKKTHTAFTAGDIEYSRAITVVFDQRSGHVLRSRTVVGTNWAPPARPDTNVMLNVGVRSAILAHASALIAPVQAAAKIVSSYGISNAAHVWVEVELRFMVEDDAGGIDPRKHRLVYVVAPNQDVQLKAVDDDALLRYVGTIDTPAPQ